MKTDLTGKRFGYWTVVGRINESNFSNWKVECDCGSTAVIRDSCRLTLGKTKSCGCKKKQMIGEKNAINSLKHGCAIDGQITPEYYVWMAMKSRCLNPKNRKFSLYGGRGINVCDEWMSFVNFLEDVGLRPSANHSLDRIDGNKGYERGNVRWATVFEQNRNRCNARDVVVNGVKQSLKEIALKTGILYATLCKRWNSGKRTYEDLIAPVDMSKSRSVVGVNHA